MPSTDRSDIAKLLRVEDLTGPWMATLYDGIHQVMVDPEISDLVDMTFDEYLDHLIKRGHIKSPDNGFGGVVSYLLNWLAFALVQGGIATLEALPDNWKELVPLADVEAAAAIVRTEGIPLAWVPRAHIVRALLDADMEQQRRQILVDQVDEVLASCRDRLEQVEAAVLLDMAGFGLSAVAAAETGHVDAAQALAATTLDTAVRAVMRVKLSTIVKEADETPFRRRSLLELRPALVFAAVAGGATRFDPDGKEPIPERFSRHATVHGVSREQYNLANGLIAIMTLTALLSELNAGTSHPASE